MSGVLSIPNQFANAVTATGLQLDTNYNTITAYINDPTNRVNYVSDAGTTNTVVLTFSPPVVGGYTAGLSITFKAAAGNTGGVVINANGLGNASLFSPAGVALTGGEITANQMVMAQYNGTAFYMVSASASGGVNPKALAKAWATWTGTATGTINALSSYNVSTIVRTGTGTYSISFTTNFATTAYVVLASSGEASFAGPLVGTRAVGGVMITAYSTSSVAADLLEVNFSAFGNQ